MNKDSRFYAERKQWRDGISLYFAQFLSGSRMAVAKSMMMETVEEGAHAEPFMTINMTEAQTLMDALWNCGVRPTEGSGSAGSLAATERHLEDMRQLVFKRDYKPNKGSLT